MPPLTINVEGLKGHSFLIHTFGLDKTLTVEQRGWHVWLIHCLVKAARHYNAARNTILMQLDEAKRSSEDMRQGRSLPILDFAEYMEDSVSSIFRASMCARLLVGEVASLSLFCETNKDAIDRLLKLRNQHDHMHTQIAAGQVGSGPIVLSLDEDGDTLRFRNCRFPLVMLHSLIQGLYGALVALYPQFDENSAPQPQGTFGISMSMSVSCIDADGNERGIRGSY
jgi:hypothetical protein